MAFIPDAPTKFVPDTPPPAAAPKAEITNPSAGGKETTEGPLGFANGLAELVGKGFGNMPMAAVHAIADVASRATGKGARPESAPTFPLSQNAQEVGATIGEQLGRAAAPYQNPLADKVLNNEYVAPVLQDVAAAAPALGAAGRVAGAIGDASAAQAASAPAAVTKYGLRTGESNPIARNVAGSSARSTVAEHNQSIADPTIGAQAGVPPGTPLTQENLEAAREAPSSVYARTGAALPTTPLSPTAAQMVQKVGADDLVVHSPDTQATVDAQKARLLSGPLTGPQVVDAQKALRFNGFANASSEDPERLALGHAQLKMADALHQHMVDTLPANADVSADQLVAARRALAQNHTVENFLKGNNIDLQGLARFNRNNPGILSGPMKDFAEFADLHPEVSSLPSKEERFNPSGVLKDIASVNPLERPVGSVAQLFGGALARRTLTGPKPPINTPVTGLGGEFAPLAPRQPPPLDLQPAPGRAFEAHQPDLATGNPQRDFFGSGTGGMTATPPSTPPAAAGGPPGQIPLADLLSHGVEQRPAEGLSLAPEAAPPQGMIPFSRNAAHEAGGLELAPEDAWFKGGKAPDLSDLGSVMSQGVPEGIMQRANNASGESPASLEAINRGTRPLAIVDKDGNEQPLLRDVTQIDRRAPKGKILIDTSTGEIVDRGGMSEGLAKGLRNRWATVGRTLGDNFTVAR